MEGTENKETSLKKNPDLFPERNIIFLYGVGGTDKKNSSSWILQRWEH